MAKESGDRDTFVPEGSELICKCGKVVQGTSPERPDTAQSHATLIERVLQVLHARSPLLGLDDLDHAELVAEVRALAKDSFR